jgi:hypothetical protein
VFASQLTCHLSPLLSVTVRSAVNRRPHPLLLISSQSMTRFYVVLPTKLLLSTQCVRVRPLSPWFDADCKLIRRNCRRLERRYRRTKTVDDHAAWVNAVRQKHVDFLKKKNDYWTTRLARENRAPRKLWQSINKILHREKNADGSECPPVNTADAFLKFFDKKVQAVRSSTSGFPAPMIDATASSSMPLFWPCTEEDVRLVLMSSPTKSCSLDLIPTFLLKQSINVLLPFVTAMCTASLQESNLPSTL